MQRAKLLQLVKSDQWELLAELLAEHLDLAWAGLESEAGGRGALEGRGRLRLAHELLRLPEDLAAREEAPETDEVPPVDDGL